MKKYFWSFSSLWFLASLAGVLAISGLFAHYSYGTRESCEVEFNLRTPVPVNFAIYYDIGEGLSQKYHQQKYIETINQKTRISFCIASYRQLRTIRFDPAMQEITMDLYSIVLRYSNGNTFNVPLDSLIAGNQIQETKLSSSSLTFSTVAGANDPTFVLGKLNDGNLPNDRAQRLTHYLLWLSSGLLLVVFGRFFLLYFCLGL